MLAKIPAMIEPMNENNAIGAEIPNDIKIGKTITAIEITGPIPVIDIKIIAVTMQSKLIVIRGLSPPSSTTFRINVAAIPLSTNTRPKKAPKNTFTKIDFAYSAGPLHRYVSIHRSILDLPLLG